MTRLEKIGADLEKARVKQKEWMARVKNLQERYREEENAVIHDMVHAANLSPERLAQIIAMAEKGTVGIYPQPEETKTENVTTEEDSEHED